MLKSFSFIEKLTPEIEALFIECTSTSKELDYGYEIIEAALNGRIDIGRYFNIQGYVNSLKATERLENHRRANKFKSIVSDSDSEDVYEPNTITEESLVSEESVDAYEEAIIRADLSRAISKIQEMSLLLMVEEKVNIARLIQMALKGIPSSVAKLKDICQNYEVIGESVSVLLSSGENVERILSTSHYMMKI